MKIFKFGGTSVGSAERMKDVARLIGADGAPKIVVLSAMSGTTNTLVEISDCLRNHDSDGADKATDELSRKYLGLLDRLYDTEAYRQEARKLVEERFDVLRSFMKQPFGALEEKIVLAQGELLSTGLMHLYLRETGVRSVLLAATDFMRIDRHAEPEPPFIKEQLTALLAKYPDDRLFLTQGFICRNADGAVDNLQRGGSDYTASLIGEAVQAEEIQIWTDIDGMHNNDPRYVENTLPVRRLHFDEAAELAYFGAKILHPTCILPAKRNGIPVRLLNTMQPEAVGTTISNETEEGKIKAVAAKDHITAIRIKSGRMLLATGFLRQVFEIFERHETPVDVVTTSEVGVSVTVDNGKHLDGIVNDLRKYGRVTVDRDLAIICVVGDLKWDNVGFASRIVNALQDIPLRMISYGGSNYNVSLLVQASDKQKALQALSDHLFNTPSLQCNKELRIENE
ncbi:MAG: aspartate kinase [Tannerella sp.]|jgi:aspartate kinase|nr:aspartate kinase [Tannerella sp.]